MAAHHPAQRLAALDLGSNSFHLLIADRTTSGWEAVIRQGEKVQLAAGLRGGILTDDAIARGLACLGRFAGYLRELPVQAVGAVGTHALRCAANRDAFLEPAQALIGHPIRVIDGKEEARLIYRGAAEPTGRQLVFDIGGGSTEIVLGEGSCIHQLASVPVGCITLLSHFPDGQISAERIAQAKAVVASAILAAWGTPAPISGALTAIGCSGTLLAVESVLVRAGWSTAGITRAGLARLQQALVAYDRIDAVQFEGLSESRRGVFATGLTIVLALFDVFGIDTMQLSRGALREGLITELLEAVPA
jgi:exopolyphosphatase/guanosine-5'-triphosphate,3'-diphosphate pyrophosphatase